MNCIQEKQKWSWSIGNLAMLTFAVYVTTVFVFSSDVRLNIISQAAFVLMCGFSFIYVLTQKKSHVRLVLVWLFCLLLLAFSSLSWSIDVSYSMKRMVTLVQLVVLCIFLYAIIDTQYKANFAINSIIFSGYIMYAYSFITVGFTGMIDMFNEDMRLGDVVNQENAFGYYSAIVFAFALYQVVYKRKKWQIIFLPLPIIMGLFSGSKKSLILLVLSAFLLITLKEKKKIIVRKVWAIIIIVVAFIILYRLGAMDLVLSRFGDALKGSDISTNNRRLFIEFGLDKIKERPMLGYGIEHYALLFEQEFGSLHPSHNNYIQILTSFGIVGFVLWYGSYVYFLVVGIKYFYKNDMAPVLVLITLMTFVNDITTTTLLNKFTYILLAMCFAIAYILRSDNKNRKGIQNE